MHPELPVAAVRILHSEPALGKVRGLAVSDEGGVLWAGAESGLVVELGLPEGTVLRRFHAHKGGVNCVQIRRERVVTGGNDGVVRVWDRATLACQLTLKAPGRSVHSVDIKRSPEGRVSVLTFAGGRAEWDLDGRPTREPFFLGERAVEDMHRGAWALLEGRRLVAVDGGEVLFGEIRSDKPIERVPLPIDMECVARIWRHGRLYVSGRLPHRRCALLCLDLATRAFAGPWLLPYLAACLSFWKTERTIYAGGNGRVFAIDPPQPEAGQP